MSKPKFNIGDTVYFVVGDINRSKRIPCPICYGKLQVTIILGNGESSLSRCGCCCQGYEGPTGFSTVYEPRTEIQESRIRGVAEGHGTSWEYQTHSGTKKEYELWATREDAKEEYEAVKADTDARAKKWFEASFVDAKKGQLWSTGYHKKEIKYHERKIEWHEMHLGKIKDRVK